VDDAEWLDKIQYKGREVLVPNWANWISYDISGNLAVFDAKPLQGRTIWFRPDISEEANRIHLD